MQGAGEVELTHPVIHRVMEWLKAHIPHGDDLAGVDAHEVERMAAELGLHSEELREFAAQGPGAQALMQRMLAAHHVNLEAWRNREPATIRDMEVQCSRCGSKDRCTHDLDAGTAVDNCAHYCPNSETIVSLMNRA